MWPTELLTLDGQVIWGRLYDVVTDAQIEVLESDELVSAEVFTTTANADLKNANPSIGQSIIDSNNRNWTIISVSPSNTRFGGRITVGLQLDLVVAG